LKIVTTYPYLATQYCSYSDIANAETNNKRKFDRSQKILLSLLEQKDMNY